MADLVKRLDFWLTIIGIGLFVMLEFDKWRAWWRARSVKHSWHIDPEIMSRDDQWSDGDQDVADDAQQDNNAATMDCNDESDSNALLFRGMAIALALMVKAGRVGETNGLHDVFHVKPSSTSPRYQAAREALKAELARLDPPARPTPIAGRVTRATFAEEDDE